jgi:hypothetical protein
VKEQTENSDFIQKRTPTLKALKVCMKRFKTCKILRKKQAALKTNMKIKM